MFTKIYLKICRTILDNILDVREFIKWERKLGFTNNDGSPRKCRYCGNEEFTEKIVDRIEGCVMEKNSYCSNCGSICGNWVTGFWMN
jgi:hypothetical protein